MSASGAAVFVTAPANPAAVPSRDEVVSDLLDFEPLLDEANRRNLWWHLAVAS